MILRVSYHNTFTSLCFVGRKRKDFCLLWMEKFGMYADKPFDEILLYLKVNKIQNFFSFL